MTTFIYSLLCPITGAPRYIGKSDRPDFRASAHIRRARVGKENHTRKSRWILSLSQLGLEPRLQILCEVPKENWKETEKEYIFRFREIGWDLVNGTEGGDGGALTGDALDRMSESQRGKKQSSDTIAKRVLKTTGKKRSPEQRQNSSKGLQAYWATQSPEEKGRRGAILRGETK